MLPAIVGDSERSLDELVVVGDSDFRPCTDFTSLTTQLAEQADRLQLLEHSMSSLRAEVAGIKFCPLGTTWRKKSPVGIDDAAFHAAI